ncbi:MAG: presenilin family intramembrane aspartyl protease [Halobacteriaceae archaeon]
MKHNWLITLTLLALYLVSHAVGLLLITQDMTIVMENGERIVRYTDTALGERPEMQGMGTLLYLALGVGIGTFALLLLMRYKQYNLWKFWFFTASFLAISLALGTIIPNVIAFGIGFGLAFAKIQFQNRYVHNATEVLMYAGLAVFFAPLLDVWWGIALLILFSIYDAYAVWQSEHMVDMAEFQSKSVFAGLNLSNKSITTDKQGRTKTVQEQTGGNGPHAAILGGGDIAIPLLFTAAVMEHTVSTGASKLPAALSAFTVSITSAGALLLLFYMSEEGSFYPAMPFITVGCVAGFALVSLV